MTTQTMPIFISLDCAPACWGKNALLSMSETGITLHVTHTEDYRTLQKAGRRIDAQNITNIALSGEHWTLEAAWHFWQGFRNPKGKQHIQWPDLNETDSHELTRRLQTIDWVRDIINQAADELSPSQLCQHVVDLMNRVANDAVSYQIIKGEQLREQGYQGLYTVGRGSTRSPALLVLDFNPSKVADTPTKVCLVGKGITFDSGGYSLKASQFMDSMKSDMGGAALVAGALALAITRGLTHRVKLILCCADNLVSGNAFKLGDIIHYRNGKTVEIMNTDAEGRLVLADGLIDASATDAPLIIDCATLTGAAKTAVGNDYHAILSFDDAMATKLLQCAEAEHELFWRLPLAEFHRQQLPSNFADLNNIASSAHTAGASTAAAFLSYFVKSYQKGWLHIDCSATYRKSSMDSWAAGATGIGVRTLANVLLTLE